jgi:hypothetical protein
VCSQRWIDTHSEGMNCYCLKAPSCVVLMQFGICCPGGTVHRLGLDTEH